MSDAAPPPAEVHRLQQDAARSKNWKRWGPYLAERQWGTVREDYSADGNVWGYFTHDQARSRAYRWGEDGLLGICDRECRLCFALALWNGQDPILKERLFGLTGPEGNHGEDVKEEYFYLDSTPTHSYLKALYKYPQAEFPYQLLVEKNAKRTRKQPEFELADTGIFKEERYFDIVAEYAKNSPNDILIKITAHNRGPETAVLHLLPTLWFRNTWSWGCRHEGCEIKPRMSQSGPGTVVADHPTLGRFILHVDTFDHQASDLLFTENETNVARLFDAVNYYPNVRDAFHDYVIHAQTGAVNNAKRGTKCAAYHGMEIPAGRAATVCLRLSAADEAPAQPFGPAFEEIFRQRIVEADEFYAERIPRSLDTEHRRIARQAYAGLLWSKQFYHYIVKDWLEGDPEMPAPPPQRWNGRNADWLNLYARDVILIPDKWEYPWFAAWDWGFHCVAVAHIDPQLAKEQLILPLREWYMHPSGQLPAYEFAFNDVNPPVHAWACWRVYKMTATRGCRDRAFLERCFHKLLINFTWWVNRKDLAGKNVFGGGFLGMDNIGLFDRSAALASGTQLDQADGTAWMAFYCLTMLGIALELASHDPVYEDVASKFFEHFVAIVDAINTLGGTGLWDETDGFYYDRLSAGGAPASLRVRSIVGLVPLIAVEVLDDNVIEKLPGFKKRLDWFLTYRKDLAHFIAYAERDHGAGARGLRLLAVPSREKLTRVLKLMLDPSEFLSPFGIRSMSRHHLKHPYVFNVDGRSLEAHYAPGESDTDLFGGNSNWRGPIWFPLNYLLVEALERYHHFYGESFQVDFPTGSGHKMNLRQIAKALSRRLTSIFLPGSTGRRPTNGDDQRFIHDPNYKDLIWFYEYFDGETGQGLGASHQTGWTALVARLIETLGQREGEKEESKSPPATPGEKPVPAI